MLKTTKKNIRIYSIFFLLFVIAVIINIINNGLPPVQTFILGLLQTNLYIAVYAIWGISVSRRILQTQVRFFLECIAALLIFWMLLRAMKYYIFIEGDFESRYLWYLFYIPMLCNPLLSFFVSISLGKPDNYKIPKCNVLLPVICVILIIAVLTNDMHRLVFTFSNKTLAYADSKHGFGFVYFLIYIWIVALSVLCLFNIIIKCRIPDIKKIIWLPIMPFVIAFIYGIFYNLGLIRIFTDMNVVYTAATVLTLECCIQCGLIRSNSGYIELFEAGSYGAKITDKNFKIEYSCESASDIPYELMCQTRYKTVKLDEHTLLNSHSITNGHIIWKSDIKELDQLIERLKNNRESIAEELTLEEQNYKAKLRINALKEKNDLYEKLQVQTAKQIDLLYDLLTLYDKETDAKKKKKILAMIIVVGTYIKRRGNLFFLAEGAKVLDCTDLTMCLKESVSNLELLGVKCALSVDDSHKIAACHACEIYDLFENIIETVLEDIEFLFIKISFINKVPKLRMEIECLTSLEEFSSIVDKCVSEEGIWNISASFGKGYGS